MRGSNSGEDLKLAEGRLLDPEYSRLLAGKLTHKSIEQTARNDPLETSVNFYAASFPRRRGASGVPPLQGPRPRGDDVNWRPRLAKSRNLKIGVREQ